MYGKYHHLQRGLPNFEHVQPTITIYNEEKLSLGVIIVKIMK